MMHTLVQLTCHEYCVCWIADDLFPQKEDEPDGTYGDFIERYVCGMCRAGNASFEITQRDAYELLQRDMQPYEECVRRQVQPLNRH